MLHQLLEVLLVVAPAFHGVGGSEHAHGLEHIHEIRQGVNDDGVDRFLTLSLLEDLIDLMRMRDGHGAELARKRQFLT